MYHQFDPNPRSRYAISPSNFSRHIDEIRDEGFNILTFDEAADRFEEGDTSSIPEVLITMDDGWAGVYDYAYPIIMEKEAPVVAFIYPRAVGLGYRGFIDWEEIRDMESSGFVNIQCHALTHCSLKKYSGESTLAFLWRLEGELYASKYILENEIGRPVTALAYPFGAYSSETHSVARRLGYKYGFSCINPFNRGTFTRMTIPRYEVSSGMTSIRSLLKRFKDVYGETPPLVMEQTGVFFDGRSSPRGLAAGMSVRELAGQVVFVGLPKSPSYDELEGLLIDCGVGGVILDSDFLDGSDPDYIDEALSICRSLPPLPVFIAIDENVARTHGFFGDEIGSLDFSLPNMRKLGERRGKRLAASGVHILFGPTLDITPENVVEFETADGYPPPTAGGLVGKATSASFEIQGIQSAGVLCAARHFPGHNPPENRDEPIAVVAQSYDVLRGRELVPFGSAAVAGVAACIMGHFIYPGIDSLPVPYSPFFYGVLRDSLGFSGIAISDDITWKAAGDNPVNAAIYSIIAGADAFIIGNPKEAHAVVAGIENAVCDGIIPRKRLEEAVARILTAKETIGLLPDN